jgi:hypothetical protein
MLYLVLRRWAGEIHNNAQFGHFRSGLMVNETFQTKLTSLLFFCHNQRKVIERRKKY